MPSFGDGLMRPNGGPRLRLHPGAQPPNEYGEIEVPEEVQIDEGDECCEEARMQFREALRASFGEASWDDIEIIVGGPCEELQQELERWIEHVQRQKENTASLRRRVRLALQSFL